jgi:type I restriction enzyme S subunit
MSGRKAAKDVRPGNMGLSVGNPNTNLPIGWKWVDLGEIARMATGHTPSRNFPEYWGGDIPWISVRDARPFHGRTITSTHENTNDLGIANSAAVVLPKDTVCLSRTGSIGYSIILGKEMATSQGFVNWICSEALIPRFLQLLFVAENTFLHSISEGVAHTTIYFPEAKAFHVALPPLAEQHRIVARIEELFSSLDKGIESLKTAREQLKVYRQAVLKWAFEGRLTNPNLKEGELPEGWVETTTGEVLETINNGYTPTKEYLSEGSGEVPFLKVYNLNFDGTLNYKKNPTFITRAIHLKELKRSICYPGDVLINIVGPPLGKVSIVTSHYPEWNINQAIVMFRPNNKLVSKYLSYFLQSPITIDWLEGTSKATAGQWNVKVTTCRQIPINLPSSVEEQLRIVHEIESRLSVCDKIEESIEQSLQQAEALRQSILKKAFEGKLVPQDPSDEPASVLLERIRAQRQTQVNKKTTKTTKKSLS